MTNVVKKKSPKCIIEWTLKTRNSNDTHVSETFLFWDRECNLQLTLGYFNGTIYDISYLYFNYPGGMHSPINVSVRVVSDSAIIDDQAPSMKSITTTKTAIWNSLNGRLLRGVLLTFEVIIYTDPPTDNKSVQISSYEGPCFSMESLLQDFSKLFDEGPYHDVEFICGDQTIKAHKSILCSRSSVFASMLQSDMVEGKTGLVNIQDMDAAIFRQFLKCLYTGKLPKLTVDSALQFYEASDKYSADAVKKQCADFLKDNLSVENACDILILSDRHSDIDFKASVMEYIIREKMLYVEPKWTNFCNENPILAVEVYKMFSEQFRPK